MRAAAEANEQARSSATHDDRVTWPNWQQAAAASWLARHPEDRDLVRPSPDHQPTIEEIRRRADRVRTAMDGVHSTWRIEPWSPGRDLLEAHVGWFHELLAGLYGPVYAARERVRTGADNDATAPVIDIETLVRFLEADIYCHRSGYVTADVIRAVRRAPQTDDMQARLRSVVLTAVDGHDRREFRAFCRLAVTVGDDALRSDLLRRVEYGQPVMARHAAWVLTALAAAKNDPRASSPAAGDAPSR